MSFNKKSIGYAVLLLVILFIYSELFLFVLERFFSINKFNEFRRSNYERFFFYHTKKIPPDKPSSSFDRYLGWRDLVEDKVTDGYVIRSICANKWRPAYKVNAEKSKIRILLLGDSYTYGWDVQADQTIDHYLSDYLGPRYEIINLSSRGWGIDQMAIKAREGIGRYDPDIVIISFISGDLDRCRHQFNYYAARKPYFIIEGGKLVLKNVPVITPYDLYKYHQRFSVRLADIFMTWLQRSRIACLIGQCFIMPQKHYYDRTVVPAIMASIKEKAGLKTKVLFFNLYGDLPPEFESGTRMLGIRYYPVNAYIDHISKKIGVPPQKQPEGHPGPGLNHIYAYAMYRQIAVSAKSR